MTLRVYIFRRRGPISKMSMALTNSADFQGKKLMSNYSLLIFESKMVLKYTRMLNNTVLKFSNCPKPSIYALTFFFFCLDPPRVNIHMGKSLVASDIREGVDVYFDCVIRANPPPKTKIVTWLHDVSNTVMVQLKCNFDSYKFLIKSKI